MAAAMAQRSSSSEQEWDGALMRETRQGKALNETKAMGILTRGFSAGGDGWNKVCGGGRFSSFFGDGGRELQGVADGVKQ
jgi:hypothetical protein